VSWEISTSNVGEKCGEFEVDAGFAPLFLQGGADKAGLFVGGAFECETETRSVCAAREAGGVEEILCAHGIVSVFCDVWFEGPVIRRRGGSKKKKKEQSSLPVRVWRTDASKRAFSAQNSCGERKFSLDKSTDSQKESERQERWLIPFEMTGGVGSAW
jgi:hypothetical protein